MLRRDDVSLHLSGRHVQDRHAHDRAVTQPRVPTGLSVHEVRDMPAVRRQLDVVVGSHSGQCRGSGRPANRPTRRPRASRSEPNGKWSRVAPSSATSRPGLDVLGSHGLGWKKRWGIAIGPTFGGGPAGSGRRLCQSPSPRSAAATTRQPARVSEVTTRRRCRRLPACHRSPADSDAGASPASARSRSGSCVVIETSRARDHHTRQHVVPSRLEGSGVENSPVQAFSRFLSTYGMIPPLR